MKHILITLLMVYSYTLFGMEPALENTMIQLPNAVELQKRMKMSRFEIEDLDLFITIDLNNKQGTPLTILKQIDATYDEWITGKCHNDWFIKELMQTRRKELAVTILADYPTVLENMEKNGHFEHYAPINPPSKAMLLLEQLKSTQKK